MAMIFRPCERNNGHEEPFMDENIKKQIMDRMTNPGWVSIRGILRDPAGAAPAEEVAAVEEVMKLLAQEGAIVLWRLMIHDKDEEMLAAARPGYELDKDLENRGAWAKAVLYAP
jgi:hypothetical protein